MRKFAHKFVINNTNHPEIMALCANLLFTKFLEAVWGDIKLDMKNFEEAVSKAMDIEKALKLSNSQSIP